MWTCSGVLATFLVSFYYVVYIASNLGHRLSFSIFFLGAIFCMGSSAVYHAFICHSETVCKLLAKYYYYDYYYELLFYYTINQQKITIMPAVSCEKCTSIGLVFICLSPLGHLDIHWNWHILWQHRCSLHTFQTCCALCKLPSVLWRCWLGGRKGIRPVKNWVLECWHGYLSGAYGPGDATATHCLLLQ